VDVKQGEIFENTADGAGFVIKVLSKEERRRIMKKDIRHSFIDILFKTLAKCRRIFRRYPNTSFHHKIFQ